MMPSKVCNVAFVTLIILVASELIICKQAITVGKCVFLKSDAQDDLKAECVNYICFNLINTQKKILSRDSEEAEE